ncbi:MAG: DUF3387 domain-containing protein [Pirellulaceae bacterium]|nr:DUF3387 domain-containing protein [Pirellulaceae bacterium]
MITDVNSEDRLVQQTFADYLRDELGWESVYAFNQETFGAHGTLGRTNEREVVLARDLRAALARLNADLPEAAREQAIEKLTRIDWARSLLQHNCEFYGYIRDGVPVEWRDASGATHRERARVIDFQDEIGLDGKPNNRFLAVRELKIQGVRVPHYNRRADLVCFVNGLPLAFIELKAVYRNIRAGFDENLTDYLSEHSIQHAFHHNVFLVVSNGDRARYGSITSRWGHFVEWKRNDEKDKGRLDAQALLDGMLTKERLLDLVEHFVLFDDSRPGGTRKIVARNHQVLGVNNAVASVVAQEELKSQFPPEKRLRHRVAIVEPKPTVPYPHATHEQEDAVSLVADQAPDTTALTERTRHAFELLLVERAHPDLGRLGVFWHTQGSGKSYSMVFFSEKVRRVVRGKIVNEAIRAQEPGEDHAEGLTVDLSQIDFVKLRDEFAKRVKRKHAALQDIRDVVEQKLQAMLARNPMRMDYYKKYQEIIADYNREKDRVTVEETFAKLVELASSLDAEQRRAVEEGLIDEELAMFDLLFCENITKADRERLKQASRSLLGSLRELVAPMPAWTQNAQTQAEVKVFILDSLWQNLPRPPYSDQDCEVLAERVYDHVWSQCVAGSFAA